METASEDKESVPRLIWLAVVLALTARGLAGLICDVSVDEGFTYFLSTLSLSQLFPTLLVESHPPGFYLITKLFSGWTHSQFWLRLPSMVCGALCPLVIYRIGRSLNLRDEALWVSFIVALNWLTIAEEAKIRMYGLLDLFTLLAIALFLSQDRNSKIERWLLLGAILVLPWIHLFGYGLVLLLTLLAFKPGWARGSERLVLVFSCLASAVWLAATVHSRGSHPNADPIGSQIVPKAADLMIFPSGIVSLDALVLWLGLPFQSWHPLALVLGVAFWLGCGVGFLKLCKENLRGGLLLGGFALVPPLILGVFSFWAGGRYTQHRYFIVFLPILLFFLFRALGPLLSRILTGLLIAVNLFLLVLLPVDTRLHTQHWRTVVDFLHQEARPEDRIVVYNPYAMVALAFYYPHQQAKFLAVDSVRGNLSLPPGYAPLVPVFPHQLTEEFKSSLGNGQVFLILHQEKSPLVREWFLQNYRVVGVYQEPNINPFGRFTVYRLLSIAPEESHD